MPERAVNGKLSVATVLGDSIISGSIAPRAEDAKPIGKIIGLRTNPFEIKSETGQKD